MEGLEVGPPVGSLDIEGSIEGELLGLLLNDGARLGTLLGIAEIVG